MWTSYDQSNWYTKQPMLHYFKFHLWFCCVIADTNRQQNPFHNLRATLITMVHWLPGKPTFAECLQLIQPSWSRCGSQTFSSPRKWNSNLSKHIETRSLGALDTVLSPMSLSDLLIRLLQPRAHGSTTGDSWCAWTRRYDKSFGANTGGRATCPAHAFALFRLVYVHLSQAITWMVLIQFIASFQIFSDNCSAGVTEYKTSWHCWWKWAIGFICVNTWPNIESSTNCWYSA